MISGTSKNRPNINQLWTLRPRIYQQNTSNNTRKSWKHFRKYYLFISQLSGNPKKSKFWTPPDRTTKNVFVSDFRDSSRGALKHENEHANEVESMPMRTMSAAWYRKWQALRRSCTTEYFLHHLSLRRLLAKHVLSQEATSNIFAIDDRSPLCAATTRNTKGNIIICYFWSFARRQAS